MSETYRSFDWEKAARIIKEKKPIVAEAGLAEDWYWTGGTIWENDGPVYGQPYTSSYWATPVLVCDGEQQECWTMGPKQDPSKVWPKEALEIINEA